MIYNYTDTHVGYLDCNGNPVQRSKDEWPYSYSDHLVWFKDSKYIKKLPKSCSTIYSDRLYQWDHTKYNKCCKEVWNNEGQYFNNRDPKDIEKFLSLYYDRPIELLKIGECCNVSSGYPIWIFFFV